MRFYLWIFCGLLAVSSGAAEIRFNFGDTEAGRLPPSFEPVLVGEGQPGEWKVMLADVPSGFLAFSNQPVAMNRHGVLAQTSADPTDEHFPMLLYTGEKFRNFKLSTRFKIVSGVVEQMPGFVFRYLNASNYYVVRASALGKNVRFYKVVDGIRSNPLGSSVELAAGEWHTLAVKCEGTQISFWYDDQLVMPPLGDASFSEGLIGFRTKSDTVAYFTDTKVEYTPIIPGAQVMVDKIMAEQTRLLGLRVYTLQTNGVTRVIAAKDAEEVGMEGTEAELKAIEEGTVSFGQEKGASVVTMPLSDRNGEYIAAVRFKLKSFFGETQNNALSRARIILKAMQKQATSARDLE